jgi:hypothetical protein
MFRSYDHLLVENILFARITQLTKDPLYYTVTCFGRTTIFRQKIYHLLGLIKWQWIRCIILLRVSVARPSSSRNTLLARITQLTTVPLFYNIANFIVIVFYNYYKTLYYTITQHSPPKKTIPWPQSVSELYRPSNRRLSAKLMPTFVDRGLSRGQRGGSIRP